MMRVRVGLSTLVGIVCLLAVSAPAGAATLQATKLNKTALAFPNALAVAPDGRVFFGERLTGRIGWVNPANGTIHTFFTVPISGTFDGHGLMSLAFARNYPSQPYLYVSLARLVNGVGKIQLARITDNGGKGTGFRVIYQTGVGEDHNASRVVLGKDGKVYLAVGDAENLALPQNLSDPHGKVLRMGPTGGIPTDNPFGHTRVWAYGFRNTIGVAFDPVSGQLWETENGPECNDEINRIVRGGNYGWGPHENCSGTAPADTNQDGPSPIMPLVYYPTPLGVTGAAFCDSTCHLGSGSASSFFFGDYNTGTIRMLRLNASRVGVAGQQIVYHHPSAVLGVESDHAGRIVFSDATGVYRLSTP
jgi:glucose/arabinose dehydrogenase